MNIDLTPLDFEFLTKPLLIGGRAKEYYGVRKSGPDIDFVITSEDYERFAKKYPNNLKDLYGDLGVVVHGFEIWKTICQFGYDDLSQNAQDMGAYRMITLEKLLFLTALGIKKDKYRTDVELIVDKIFEQKYKNIETSKYQSVE